MGESDRYVEYKDKNQPGGIHVNINSPVVLLVIINFSVFLFVKFLSFGQITGDTALVPFFYEKLNTFLVNAPFRQVLHQPWSLLTYSFFQFSFLTLLSNMLWLWCFGSILQSFSGNRNTIPVYLYGAFAGAVAFVSGSAIAGLYPVAPLFGANAAVMADRKSVV